MAETPKETRIFVKLYADIVVRINQILKSKGWSQKELASKIGKNPSEINKWLKGEHNFTLRSLAKLQAELEETIIEVKKDDADLKEHKKGHIRAYAPAKTTKNFDDVEFSEPKIIPIETNKDPKTAYAS